MLMAEHIQYVQALQELFALEDVENRTKTEG